MRTSDILLALCGATLLSGCTTVVNVPAEESRLFALLEARNNPSTIALVDRRTLDADSLTLGVDSVQIWHDEASETFHADAIARISIREGAAFGPGLGYGFLAGAGIGLLGLLSDDHSGQEMFPPALGVGCVAVAGALTGGILGGLAGSWTVYELAEITPLEAQTVILSRTIVVPAFEYEDDERVTFFWKGKLVWLRKSSITTEAVPGGIAITMSQTLRERLN